jgi:3-(3-hydroxy-phenyl)propionate hydroxylase
MPDHDVILVGYGPTAALLANLLAPAGWRIAVHERSPTIHDLPRAVHFDDEVMRLLQQAGVADALLPHTAPVRGMELVNARGQRLARYQAPPEPTDQGWASGYMFHQPELEAVLRAAAARHPGLQVHLGTEVTAIDASGDSVRVQVRGPQGTRQARARYLVGCCGARSATRQVLGARMQTLGPDQSWIVVDLQIEGTPPLPDMTVQYCDPQRPATFVPMPGNRRRFELMLMPGDTAENVVRPEWLQAALAPWLQPGDYRIERAAVYTFHALVADRWRAGPLLLAGDAAHQMPPFLGQGLCSGARDAANLAWKLDLVLRGTATDALLDTYQAEREAHVRALIESDLWLGGMIQTTDPLVAARRDQAITSDPAAATLVPPAPRLGEGLCDPAPPAGRPFCQPVLPNGRRHDVALGAGFTLVGEITPSSSAARLLERLSPRGFTHLAQPPQEVQAWLREAGVRAVLVRPDRQVLAGFDDADGLDRALLPLAACLTPER